VRQREKVQELLRKVSRLAQILIEVGALTKNGFEIIDLNGHNEAIMAGNLHVRNLDDDLIVRLKRRAARHGRSTEAEHREILRQALANEHEPSFEKLASDLRKITAGRKQTPSEVLQRQGRAER
jgi:antitoxin FitA